MREGISPYKWRIGRWKSNDNRTKLIGGILEKFRCFFFKEADLIWAQFVANNRNGFRYARMMTMSENNLRGQYDLVIGQIADGRVTNITRTLQAEKAAVDEAVLSNFRRKEYSKQYAFHSRAAIDMLRNGRIRLI